MIDSARRHRPLGPVMIDVEGLEMTAAERELIAHPVVGGVILFARNYESPRQLRALTAAIRAVRSPAALIAVDHEGGRVQRFQQGFTRLPAMRAIGGRHDLDADDGAALAYSTGLIMATELVEHGIDISFAPVLDIDFGGSSVIGDRAFHRDPGVVARLAARLVAGMRDGGMAGIGKHFPGHGFARGDSHHELPHDDRPIEAIWQADLAPYRTTIPAGLGGVMPAHVVYSAVDDQPAGFSSKWLNGVLRGELGFRGLVFSDDLSMEGAKGAGSIGDRAMSAFAAGCDMVLVCNDAPNAMMLLEELPRLAGEIHVASERLAYVRPETDAVNRADLHGRYLEARRVLARTMSA